MGSLPPDRAGIGSAVNDTTRELGGALGVAIVGSIMSSLYGSRLDRRAAGRRARAGRRRGAGVASGAAVQIDRGSSAAQVADAAREAFVHAMSLGHRSSSPDRRGRRPHRLALPPGPDEHVGGESSPEPVERDLVLCTPIRPGALGPLLCYLDWSAAGWSSLVARRAHNPKVEGSNPSPATIAARRPRSLTWAFVIVARSRPWPASIATPLRS